MLVEETDHIGLPGMFSNGVCLGFVIQNKEKIEIMDMKIFTMEML